MKIILSVSTVLVLFVLVLPIFTVKGGLSEPEQTAGPEATLSPAPSPSATPSPVPTDIDSSFADAVMNVRLLTNGRVETISMHDYLIGVVAAEMPASFSGEALKAQAVAARTYMLYKLRTGSNHDNADICDDSACCNAYLSADALKEKWGDKYDFNIGIITNAVAETDGLCVTYQDEPILAAFHSSSTGFTEDSVNVWTSALPYLVSVESPEGGTGVPNYYSELVVSFEEFKNTVKADFAEAIFGDDPDTWLSNAELTESGRIKNIEVGGVVMTGTQLRLLFGLRSAAIEWTIEETGIRFKVTGYGHGVGLSQYGANEFAKNGAGFIDILEYYYKGTEVVSYGFLQAEEKLL